MLLGVIIFTMLSVSFVAVNLCCIFSNGLLRAEDKYCDRLLLMMPVFLLVVRFPTTFFLQDEVVSPMHNPQPVGPGCLS
jgi:hypothetical protein